jgi:endonuclease G
LKPVQTQHGMAGARAGGTGRRRSGLIAATLVFLACLGAAAIAERLARTAASAGTKKLIQAGENLFHRDGAAGVAHTDDNCASQLPLGRDPAFTNPGWSDGLQRLCRSEFVLGHSSKTRTALWSAERLTRSRLQAARKLSRDSRFFEEPELPAAARGRLRDYARSGWQRGHLSPSGDMSTAAAQQESFSLANMVPQDPDSNRYLWESIESGTRDRAMDLGELFVITGPLFQGTEVAFINDRIATPSHLWKLLYDARNREGGVFLAENNASKTLKWLAIADFEQLSGYRFGLAAPKLMRMHAPRQHFREN